MSEKPGEITELLILPDQDSGAADRLWELVYPELRRRAGAAFRNERIDHTLSPTAVLNETFIRLSASRPSDWEDRTHFYAIASNLMRQVLIDHARKHNAAKRNDGIKPEPLEEAIFSSAIAGNAEAGSAERALDRLAESDQRGALVVSLKVFGGLTIPEVAVEIGVSESTVKTDLKTALAALEKLL